MYGITSLATISLATLLLAVSVSAGLYGTAPVASTVWSAGRSQTVTWIDDKSAPHLGQLGPMDIELLNGDDVSVPPYIHTTVLFTFTRQDYGSYSSAGS